LLARSRERFDYGSLDGATRAADWVLSILARVPVGYRPGLNVQDVKLAKTLDTLSYRLGIDVNTLRGKLKQLRRRASKRVTTDASIRVTPLDVVDGASPVATPSGDSAISRPVFAPIHPADLDQTDREFIEILLNEPEAASDLASRISVGMLKDAPLRAIFQVYQDLRDEGEVPGFERILLRLDDPNLRAFVAGLLLPIEPGALPESIRPAPWPDRLRKLIPAILERERQTRLRDLKKALIEADVSADPDARLALQVEYRRLLNQRPDTKSDAS
jgi:DNA primase